MMLSAKDSFPSLPAAAMMLEAVLWLADAAPLSVASDMLAAHPEGSMSCRVVELRTRWMHTLGLPDVASRNESPSSEAKALPLKLQVCLGSIRKPM
jgi:hypothetical protein